jgi:protein-disulfide isomerase
MALLLLGGCKDNNEEPAAAVVDAAPTAPADPAACNNYATQLCEAAGQETSTCASAEELAKIMPPAACAAGIAELGYSKSKLGDVRKSCDELVTQLCGDLGEETDTCKMVRAKTNEIGGSDCDGMLEQYPAVLADLQKMEEANQPLDEEKSKMIADGDHPSFGPENAAVTIVEFSDFQCPYCSEAASAVQQVREKYEDKARFVFRQFPLSFHQDAHLAAQAALAAHKQGKFWEYHDKLFANQEQLGREELETYAKDVGLNMTQFKSALDNNLYAQQVDDDLELGKTVYVQGTPTIFINGKRVQNATNFTAISEMIDGELAARG